MPALVGYFALLLTLIFALCSAIAALIAARFSRPSWVSRVEGALFLVAGMQFVAVSSLLYLLLSRDFQSQYVYAHVSSYQPTIYVISALWAGEEGSLLLWTMLLGLCAVAVILLQKDHSPPALWPFTLAVLAAIQAFFALLLVTVQNPFFMLATRPLEGAGLTPLLENPAMIIHPPVLFLGYATYSVPFAMALASLLAGQSVPIWHKWLRQWSLIAWLFLGTGIAIGAWWAYVELGWGGYWSWDPVENASLIPWLIGTAALHTLMAEERQGIFRRWNAALNVATFLLCVLATLVTRGGVVISDLHGFAQTIQPVAYYLIAFLVTATAITAVLLFARRNQLADRSNPEQLLSRESSLFITNLILTGLAVAILIGMFFPNLAQALGGTRIHLSADFYGRVFAPLGLAILLLLGVCPSLGWRESSLTRLVTRLRYPILCAAVIGFMLFLLGTRQPMALFSCMLIGFAAVSVLAEPTRQTLGRIRQQRDNPFKAIVTLWKGNRRSYGGKLVHLAILLIAIGITGSSLFKSASTVTLARGNQATIKNYIVQYEGTQILDSANTRRYVASVALYKGPSPVALLQPEKNFHYSIGQYVTEVAIRSTLTEDVYIALDWPEQDGLATFRLAVYPLVSWLWIGTGLLLGGTLISLWPSSSAMKELPNEPSTA